MRYSATKVDRIDLPGPASKSTDVFPYALTMDGAGRLYGLFNGRGFRRLENGQWTDLATLGVLSCGIILASDSAGRVWEGCTRDRIILLEGNQERLFTNNDGLNVGTVGAIKSRKDSVWIGGDGGQELPWLNLSH